MLTQIGVPTKLAEPIERGDGLVDTMALQAAQSFVREWPRICVLAGDVGTGKSIGGVWALHHWLHASAKRNPWGRLEYYAGVCWVTAPVFARLQAWDPMLAELDRAPLLVIDDLGEESGGDKSIALINCVITNRFATGNATLVTTNQNSTTFRARYGERIVDRIRECGLNSDGKAKWWVRCSGDSLRGRTEPRKQQEPTTADPEATPPPMPLEEMGEVSREITEQLELEEGASILDIADRIGAVKRFE